VIPTIRGFFRQQKQKNQFFRDRRGQGPGFLFYAEDENSWPHLGPIITRLTGEHDKQIFYATSSEEDPLLHTANPNIRSYYIGDGLVRTGFFQGLSETLVVMTMPSLGSMYIKKSKFPGMHHAYVHHSMVSTHLAYLPQAFDHFDTILCVGPHHVAETRATEAVYALPAKRLIEHGYCRLDLILADAPAGPPARRAEDAPARVLLAPSWGDHAILETIGEQLITKVLDSGHQLTVRPHPQTPRFRPELIKALEEQFAGHERCTFEQGVSGHASLLASDVMSSDWSGAALEYAFGV
jgi:YidC/Oxa1 family membrane protein insertase